MKGLLLKDLYMMRYYCKSYLLITFLFLAISLTDNGSSMFFAFFPALICGMIPVNLLAYDERSHFLQYGATLPYTKSQIVSSKYLVGLFVQIAVILLSAIAQGIKLTVKGKFEPAEFFILIISMFIISTLASSISLPFIFKFGVEKGRIAYYVMIGFVCGASVIFSNIFGKNLLSTFSENILLFVLSGLGILLYIASWYLSIMFFKKREL